MTVSLVIGVDPGRTGAIAFMAADGTLIGVEDMPVDEIQVGTGKRSRVAIPRLLLLLKGTAGAHAFTEQPTYRPMTRPDPKTGIPKTSNMGVAGAGAFGEGYGCIITALVASGCKLTEVRPGAWGKSIGLKGGKDDARRLVSNLFPESTQLFVRKKDHNRAEAALIAHYGVRQLRGN